MARMYSTRYVQCNSGGQSSADRGATESGSAEVLFGRAILFLA